MPYSARLVTVGYAGIACLGSVEPYLGLLAQTRTARGSPGTLRSRSGSEPPVSATLPLAHSLRDFSRLLSELGQEDAARAKAGEAQTLAAARNLTALLDP